MSLYSDSMAAAASKNVPSKLNRMSDTRALLALGGIAMFVAALVAVSRYMFVII